MQEIKNIIKRDGREVLFDVSRIQKAIFKAAQAVGGSDQMTAWRLAIQVYDYLKETENLKPTVEEVQDVVEKVLIKNGHAKTAKAYILYRDKRTQVRTAKAVLLNIEKTISEYINQIDWRIKENANIDYSHSGLMLHTAGAVIANYVLNNVYTKEIKDAHVHGFFHIHDLGMGTSGYCAGWSLKQLLHEGFNGPKNKVAAGSAKHFDTALGQMVNFLGTLQNEWSGAQAFNNFDTLLAPYVRADKLSYKEVRQGIQQFIFSVNTTSRWGGQSPFTNITLDLTIPEHFKREAVSYGGKTLDETYASYQKEVDMINRAFVEVMLKGDHQGRIFPFPIPTYNVGKNFDWESENSHLLFEMTAKYGTPYFQNFINSDLNPEDVRSMCCRLSMNLKELRHRTGGLFGSGDETGSLGVVTLNMPRLAYLSKRNIENFFELIEECMLLAKTSLEIKRKMLEDNLKKGLFPYTARYLPSFKNHFSTIGLIGMNEACLNLISKDIATEEGRKLALSALNFMRKKIITFQQETGNLYNLEATPAEGASFRLSNIDKQELPDIITAGSDEAPYYTNSTWLPVEYTDDPILALELQEELQTKYTGGTTFHFFLGEALPNADTCKLLVKRVLSRYRIPYLSVTPTFSVCPKHGYLTGEKAHCPHCGAETEVYSRVVGYYRPVANWNKGKKEEYKHRKFFKLNEVLGS
ncbi:MAG: anaerobic ribonucleoside-triphosphate reductase [Syntrophobacter sp. DG_60]|nr:MAG: anaerobic ribonucleoside-triphosphate reductase [Syntrophobacter sp. DG_60]